MYVLTEVILYNLGVSFRLLTQCVRHRQYSIQHKLISQAPHLCNCTMPFTHPMHSKGARERGRTPARAGVPLLQGRSPGGCSSLWGGSLTLNEAILSCCLLCLCVSCCFLGVAGNYSQACVLAPVVNNLTSLSCSFGDMMAADAVVITLTLSPLQPFNYSLPAIVSTADLDSNTDATNDEAATCLVVVSSAYVKP